ncbi:unnamed protein product [Paramecium sonneborni]|uniref:Uncharacterized protein n=1 Tax=Paramecium sonneborni TaxID=65129 RepID=A0A8S1RHV1_9CILI|nr:unnamed protein product [Paramecium sonneborni]
MRMDSIIKARQFKIKISSIKRISQVFVIDVATKQQQMREINGLLDNVNILPEV